MTPDDGAVAGSGRPRSVGRWIIVGTAAYILISGIALAVFLHYLRSEDLAASSRLVASFAQLAEEQTVRTMQTAERLLDRMRERLDTLDADSARDVAAVDGAFRSLVAGRDFLTGAWVIDANGRVLYDTGGNRGLDLSDREYFRRHRANEDLTLAVGVPLRSRASGAWFIPVTATRRLPDGSFGGVIVVALNPRPFDRVWSLDAAGEERVVALFRRDGVLLMRSPFVADAMGRSFADVEVFRDRLPTVPAGVFRTVGVIDRQDRLLAYRSLRAYPELVIVVSDRIGALLEGWRRVAWTIAIGWLAGSAAIALLAAWLVREWQRRRRSEGGLATALVSLQAKIGEHERAVADAEMARTRLADAIGVFPGSFRLFDRDGRLVLTNDVQWVEDPAVVPRVAVGMRIEDMVRTAAELELELAAVGRPEEWRRERLAQFRRGHTDTEVAWRDGRWFHLLERHTSDGGTVSLRLDITAHKKLEEQLRQAQKMEAVGQLTGGIAHDFNNMLTVIIGNAEIVTEIATDPAVRAASEQILRAAESSAELTGRLLAFARRTPLQPRPVEINRFVAGMEGLLRRTLGEDIEIGLMLAADVWAVTIDPAQLQAAILNLAVNARDAMPDGGRLTIETANAEIDAAYAAANEGAASGHFVMLAISDTGLGMSRETLERAFEPFYSTKEVGKGTGLGLSMVYGFVRQSGGHVKIYSELGRGTTVRMYLPRVGGDEAPVADAAPAGAVPRARDGETILVVEDDALVRSWVAMQASRLGYRVLEAVDGPRAVETLSGRERIDLLLTDVVMPGGMTGRDVAAAAQRLRPGIAVLYMSGYTRNAIVHGGRLDPDARLLSKPFRMADLAAKAREAIDGVPTGGGAP